MNSAALQHTFRCAVLAESVWVDCRLGEYSLHDLVVLDQQTVGVIISIGSDSCQVLTNKNQVRQNVVVAAICQRRWHPRSHKHLLLRQEYPCATAVLSLAPLNTLQLPPSRASLLL